MDHQEPHSTPRASPRIEVTVQSLYGIASNKSRDEWGWKNDTFPRVTATIAFSGSASDMQVGSSTLCATTGQLVIESKAAVIDPGALQTKHACGLTAEWHEERPSANCRPHLTVSLQECDPKAYKIPLPSINRDSRVVKEGKGMDQYDSDVSISTIDTPRHTPPSRGGSAFWSNSGAAALPEIVELFVSLKTQDGSTDGQVWQGIAHLVVFGHEDDQGTFSMELPIKKPSHSELSTPNDQPDIFLTTEARLRVEVKVFPNENEREIEKIQSSPKIASSSSESHVDVAYSRSMLDEQMEKLLGKIQKNEELALEHVQNQKNAMDVNVPMEDYDDEDDHDDHPAFCNGLWSWDRLWRTLSVVVQRCDEEAAHVVAVSADNSDCSTIATRYSLDI
jgi:hypothetical protein